MSDHSNSSTYSALRHGAGFYRRKADFVTMSGADRARFLNGQVTCDVSSLGDDDTTYGFFTTAKGRIESDVTVVGDSERWLLHLPVDRGEVIRDRLQKYIIVDRVEVELGSFAAFACVGPNAEDLKAALPDSAKVEARSDGFNAWISSEDEDAVAQAWQEAGGVSVDDEAWERYRIESSRPRWGQDFGLDHFPKETGLEDAVSYTKGCYLGQEVVARIHYRGGVQRSLRGLLIQSEHSLEQLQGATLTHDNKSVGTLTSLAHGQTGSEAADSESLSLIGLAIVHHKADIGTDVELTGTKGSEQEKTTLGQAKIVSLPFA